ncbi:hypothetical protein I6E68_11110 [Salinibacterium sp. NSLL150]|uniref:hypothetical protein n=1 Tax=unclassified Salinibacterium TaxID=2632331 RepID=UPI0018CDB5FA|nr:MULTISPECIES: hypothetical protein [unclassified Salinibacterium]MBH0099684.1 hypothetical protein [Salinibacterium sp. NSLL35]MBH0102438.1 hypothetical protein [Salinibacterium sp. NSLL150]MBH0105198.1 hypothetical protein [Salinibacterium sp. NSLL16]MBH0107958.1 hypothetical protein [Salinibacterium sp. NSLL17]
MVAVLSALLSGDKVAQAPVFVMVVIELAAAITVLVRAPFLGVWLYDDRILARTLWRTINVNRSELENCFSVPFRTIPPGGKPHWMKELQLDLLDDTQRRLGTATATRARLSELQVRQVRAYIDGTPIEQTLAIARAADAASDAQLSETSTGDVSGG